MAVSIAVNVLKHVNASVAVRHRHTSQDVSAIDAIHVPAYQS